MSQPGESGTRVPDLGRFWLGEWSVHQAEGTLNANGRSVRLEPRVMDVLVCLASEQGNVVSKDHLLETVWGGAFVEEGALSQAIHSLRKALGDDPRQPRYIQTIPKRGYRLIEPAKGERAAETAEVQEKFLSAPIPARGPVSLRRWPWLLVAIAGLATVLVLLILGRERRSEARTGLAGGPRIVVLPFEDLNKPDDPYFSAGLTQEVTANLALISSLQVIPSRSAARYRGQRKSIAEIGKELKVDYILEGKVNWSTGQVRVMPQLIRVAGETIVWVSPYEGKVDDPFSAQEEISREVIGEMKITLMPHESRALARRPTDNLEAYHSYVRGLVLKNQPFYSPGDLEKATFLFRRAVEKDPEFTEAWAELSQVHSYVAFNTDPSPGRVEKAREALKHALELARDLPAVRMAQVYFSYRCLADFDAALAQVEEAVRESPNDPELLKTRGLVLLRKGRFSEALKMFRQASSLDPQTSELVWIIADTHRALREYAQADREFAQAITLAADIPFFWEQRALNRLSWRGNTKEARAILDEAPMPRATPQLEMVDFELDLDERNYIQALARLSSASIKELPQQDQSRLAAYGVVARNRLGDREGARAAAQANLSLLRAQVIRYPKEATFRAYLALALAQLGQESEALAQAEQAVRQSQNDAYSGPRVLEVQAMVDATLGRRIEAVARLRRLLSLQYRAAINSAELRLDPMWDPLRGDPAFEALISDPSESSGEEIR